MTTERRKYDRISAQLHAVLTSGEQYTISGETVDISAQGVMLECHTTLPADTPCRIKLTLHREKQQPLTIEVDGTVVRVEETRMAIEFHQVSLDGYHKLRDLVEQRTDSSGNQIPD